MASAATRDTQVSRDRWARSLVQRLVDLVQAVRVRRHERRRELAPRLGLDAEFAPTVEEYLAARQRLRVSRTGWRASQHLRW